MNFIDNLQFNANKYIKSQGFLVYKNVPLARTGEQRYLPSEMPGINAGADGYIRVTRPEEEVFHPEAIASFENAPLTFNHPEIFVDTENYASLMKGIISNPRRGEGDNKDFLVGDITIFDKAVIDKVLNKEIKELSGGYRAEYDIISDGFVRQKDIRGNHVALVERGRCGGRCAINDKEPVMADKKNEGWFKRFTKSFKDNEGDVTAAMEAANNEPQESDQEKLLKTMIEKMIMPLMARVEELAAQISKPADSPEGEKEEDDEGDNKPADPPKSDEDDGKKDKTEDAKSVYVNDTMADTLSRAEILMPGIKLNNQFNDSVKVFDRICSCQKQALKAAFNTEKGNAAIKPFIANDSDIDKLSDEQTKTIFISASEIMKVKNNSASKVNDHAKTTINMQFRDKAMHSNIEDGKRLQQHSNGYQRNVEWQKMVNERVASGFYK